ncbi:MAG: hypothetical protein E7541_00975 [Ruminococcaceae bacterium]|nr:hypothetical protein [Oscillospiraceae bacterium]
MILSIISLLLSLAALGTALWRRPGNTAAPGRKAAPPREEVLVARQEWHNFMHYDGTPQPPIDPTQPM